MHKFESKNGSSGKIKLLKLTNKPPGRLALLFIYFFKILLLFNYYLIHDILNDRYGGVSVRVCVSLVWALGWDNMVTPLHVTIVHKLVWTCEHCL